VRAHAVAAARARSSRGSCAQLVVARELPDLDRRLRGNVAAAGAQRARVLEGGDRPVTREDPGVSAGDLAGVKRDGGDGALVGDDLNPAPN
jgi:hypothetical protein